MKVNEGHGVILQETSKQIKRKNTNDNSFREMIEQISSAHEKTTRIDDSKKIQPVINGIESMGGIGKTQSVSTTFDKQRVVETLRETLDLVDFYSAKLGDRSVKASSLSPLIDHLDERMNVLNAMEKAEDISEKIKPVISDLKISIGTEIMKFRRGDYI